MRRRTLLVGLVLALAPAPLVLDARGQQGAEYNTERKANIPYYDGKDADATRQSVIVWLPVKKKDFPVLVYVHGGGWVSGNNSQFDSFGAALAGRGVGVVLVNHRFAPAHMHPAQIEDVARALAWTHKNIAKYGGRPEQIVLS